MIKVDDREANTAIRTLLRAGYGNPAIKQTLDVSMSRIDQNRSQLEKSEGLPRPARINTMTPRHLKKDSNLSRQLTTALAIYVQLKGGASAASGEIDIVALTRAHTLFRATLLDRDVDPTFCINLLHRYAQFLESGRIRFQTDLLGDMPMLSIAGEEKNE